MTAVASRQLLTDEGFAIFMRAFLVEPDEDDIPVVWGRQHASKLFAYGQDRMAAWAEGRERKSLEATEGVTISQSGTDAVIVTFSPDLTPAIATILGCRPAGARPSLAPVLNRKAR